MLAQVGMQPLSQREELQRNLQEIIVDFLAIDGTCGSAVRASKEAS